MNITRNLIRSCRQLILSAAVCAGCGHSAFGQSQGINETVMGQFREPWALEFLPDGRALVTEKAGALKLLAGQNQIYDIGGVPEVVYGGQGGLGDIVLHPNFAANQIVYISYAERDGSDPGRAGAAVARARLELTATGGTLRDLEVIWRQWPKIVGTAHYSHRIAFDAAGYLWITSGDRQRPRAQQMDNNLGKIVRLHEDGSVPADNPFVHLGGIAAQIWSLGHRNVLGIAFDGVGRLWAVEMGPAGGDELNLILRGDNYGWPIVSEGRTYGGVYIPNHHTRPEFRPPVGVATPVISPSSIMFYTGSHFPDWHGNAFISGLTRRTVSRLEFPTLEGVLEAQRFRFSERVRAVEQGPEGGIWLLEDEKHGRGGRLIRYTSAVWPLP